MTPRTAVLIVAAGRGARLGGDLPKQYQELAGQPVLRRAVLPFLHHPRIDAVQVVIHEDDRARYDAAVEGLALLPPVAGGATRQESGLRGLESLVATAPDQVLIHDAARPCVSAPLIDRVLDALADHQAVVPALPVADTVKRVDADDFAVATVDRSDLRRVQTPQGFAFDAILAAHRAAGEQDLTDDAAVAAAQGIAVKLVPGSPDNVKLTTPDDVERLTQRLGAGDVRVGTGFDVHRLGPGTEVRLCGVAIPHDRGLQGHSDADVGLHALTDAILGAVASGDIGAHFPPGDPTWQDADSAIFLRAALDHVTAAGGMLCHADITLICEAPKLAPYRQAMRERVSAILGVPLDRVSIKATTTERLGVTGRCEGVAAQAVATVRL